MLCKSQQLLCQNNSNFSLYCLDVPSFESFDCGLLENCWCPPAQANPDLAGLGVRIQPTLKAQYLFSQVIIAFLFSALLAWITTVGYVVLEPRNHNKTK
jgi:hypothetical protein